ncbi:MAG TPA: hypothetical protein VGB37_04420 [Candidatus Lokiarchaeia archaeon]
MFEILVWFPVFLLAGYICEKIFWRDYGPFNVIIYCFSFVGVAIHELCHFVASILVGVTPKAISVRLKSEVSNKVSPHGYVYTGDEKKSFMQAFLIGLAPLFISTWLFFFCLHIIFFNPSLNGVVSPENVPYIILACGFVSLSLLVGLTPSKADLRFIARAFAQDVRYSLYQVFLALFSGFLVWVVLFFFKITLSLDILYYALVFACYYGVKYLFYFVKCLVFSSSLEELYKPNSNVIKTRKRHKAMQPRQLKIKENQW